MTKSTDLDLDMKELRGETEIVQESTEELTDAELSQLGIEDLEEFQRVLAEEEWKETLRKLDEATKYTWFCLPHQDGTLEIGEIFTASDELFLKWINYIWPVGSEKRTAGMFNTPTLKEKAIFNVLQYMKSVVFPKDKKSRLY